MLPGIEIRYVSETTWNPIQWKRYHRTDTAIPPRLLLDPFVPISLKPPTRIKDSQIPKHQNLTSGLRLLILQSGNCLVDRTIRIHLGPWIDAGKLREIASWQMKPEQLDQPLLIPLVREQPRAAILDDIDGSLESIECLGR